MSKENNDDRERVLQAEVELEQLAGPEVVDQFLTFGIHAADGSVKVEGGKTEVSIDISVDFGGSPAVGLTIAEDEEGTPWEERYRLYKFPIWAITQAAVAQLEKDLAAWRESKRDGETS